MQSVLAQEGVEVEVLIIDDCSPDDTHIVGPRLADRDARVEYTRHEVNRGLIGTINHGLEWADGDYVVVLSSDDFLTPGALARAVAVMEERPEVGLVYGAAPYLIDGRPAPAVNGTWRGTTIWSGDEWIRVRCRSAHNCISSPEVVVRTSAHRAAGRVRPGVHPHERSQHVAADRGRGRRRLCARGSAGALPRAPRQHAPQQRRPDDRPHRATDRVRRLLRVVGAPAARRGAAARRGGARARPPGAMAREPRL